MEVTILAAIEDVKDTQRRQNRQLINIISYLKVEDEETDLPNNINLPLHTMDALDQLETTLNDSVKLTFWGSTDEPESSSYYRCRHLCSSSRMAETGSRSSSWGKTQHNYIRNQENQQQSYFD